MKEALRRELTALLGIPVQWNCSLKNYTSFRIGGPAQALVEVRNLEELGRLLLFLEKHRLTWRVIGRGTNILVRDEGFDGVIVLLSGAFDSMAFAGEDDGIVVEAGAGHSLTKLAVICATSGFTGLEFAMGIPGSVGGAVIMNAGAWGGCMADVLVEVTTMTAAGVRIYGLADLRFSYRNWCNWSENPSESRTAVVTSVKMKLLRGSAEKIRQTCSRIREKRAAVQPTGTANAGSIFRNPPGDSAGRLIEESGLKEMTMGGAQVSGRHANFIINTGKATAADVIRLISFIQEKVHRDSGIFLEPEVHIL